MKFEDQRKLMVREQIKGRGVTTKAVLDAFLKVPREEFVPEDIRHLSYHDSPLGIGEGQTISQPYIVALMIDLADVKPTDKVLEIGTGSGYEAALLAEMCESVYTVERIRSLSLHAQNVLSRLGYENIYFKIGDGTHGWENGYPECDKFDSIIVSAAAPQVPQHLLGQLADGGKLVIPAGSRLMQELYVVERRGDEFYQGRHGGCAFVPLIGDEGWQL